MLQTPHIVKVTNTELWDINRLMSYRDAQWCIKDTWVGFSKTNIAKQAVAGILCVSTPKAINNECRYIPENHLVLLSNHNIKCMMLNL